MSPQPGTLGDQGSGICMLCLLRPDGLIQTVVAWFRLSSVGRAFHPFFPALCPVLLFLFLVTMHLLLAMDQQTIGVVKCP